MELDPGTVTDIIERQREQRINDREIDREGERD